MKGCPIFPDPMLQESFIFEHTCRLARSGRGLHNRTGEIGWAIGAFATDIVTVNRLRNCPL